jgi:hypothetical protein
MQFNFSADRPIFVSATVGAGLVATARLRGPEGFRTFAVETTWQTGARVPGAGVGMRSGAEG